MAESEYCELADLYDYGLPRGALPNPGRLISSISPTTEIVTLADHGFALDQELRFRAEAGGSLPAALVEGVSYYAIPVSDATFKVAATPGGAPLDFATAGSRIVVVTPLPVTAAIRWASGVVDDTLPAHVVPLEAPYPVTVRAATAQLAAAKLLAYTGQSQGSLGDAIAQAQKLLDRWARGIPIRGAVVPPPANLAVSSVARATDPRGWSPEGGTLP